MISADSSINIAFNFVEKKELEINWLVKEYFTRPFSFSIQLPYSKFSLFSALKIFLLF